ncbi:MAG: PAS domain S-box protein, partial [Bacteroidota bacterium]
MKTEGNKTSVSAIYKKINELPTAAILLDDKDNILSFNKAFCELTGYQNSELLKSKSVIYEEENDAV